MTFGSVFSGIGGMDLGLERAGWECRWQVEIDDYCRRVLAKHWPNVPRHGNIKELRGDELERVDLIAGGFPCQPVSVAGRRRGQDDERWLWPEFARLIGVLRPRFALLENVPGLLTAGMGDVLGDLSALGYDAEWSIVSACAMGAPHPRERVFLVAYSNGQLHGHGHDGASPLFADGPESNARCRRALQEAEFWAVEPDLERMANGVPRGLDRLRGLGNAVVPQVAEWIGRRIKEAI